MYSITTRLIPTNPWAQAVLEFQVFNPLSSSCSGPGGGPPALQGPASWGAPLRLFDAFWESGAPRVGEQGARGWAAWYVRQHR